MPEEDLLKKLVLHCRSQGDGKRRSQRWLALSLGVSQRTVWGWENGEGIGVEAREKLSNFLGRTVDDLSRYLNGSIPLEDFLMGATEVSRSRRLIQILEWLPELSPSEIFQVIWESFLLMAKHFGIPLAIASNPKNEEDAIAVESKAEPLKATRRESDGTE
jgi:transcriptional regulator with XRE-family HTH domain